MKNQKSVASSTLKAPALKAKAHKTLPTAKTPVVPSLAASTPEAVKAEAAPSAAKTPKTPKASKYVSADAILGRRMRVAEYQDYSFSVNDQASRQLTDVGLCADWQRQFPNAVKFEAFHVRGARRDFNVGLHSKAFPGRHDSAPYITGADGVTVKAAYTRAVKIAATKGDTAGPKTPDVTKTDAAKKVAQAVIRNVRKVA